MESASRSKLNYFCQKNYNSTVIIVLIISMIKCIDAFFTSNFTNLFPYNNLIVISTKFDPSLLSGLKGYLLNKDFPGHPIQKCISNIPYPQSGLFHSIAFIIL